MHYIDAFNHFFPKALWDRIQKLDGAGKDIGRRMQGIPCIYDLETRFRVMDEFADYRQIISLGMPPLEAMGGPELSTEFARIGNDGQAELVRNHPDRFAGFVAALPMNAPEAAAREAERASPNSAPTACRSTPTSTARRSTRSVSSRSLRWPRSTTSRCCCIPRAIPR
jgi:predicted TIM-barrel fold metal-dependent hydrolase